MRHCHAICRGASVPLPFARAVAVTMLSRLQLNDVTQSNTIAIESKVASDCLSKDFTHALGRGFTSVSAELCKQARNPSGWRLSFGDKK